MGKDYIQTYDDEVRCQFWWDAFKIVVPPVFEEEKQVTQDESLCRKSHFLTPSTYTLGETK